MNNEMKCFICGVLVVPCIVIALGNLEYSHSSKEMKRLLISDNEINNIDLVLDWEDIISNFCTERKINCIGEVCLVISGSCRYSNKGTIDEFIKYINSEITKIIDCEVYFEPSYENENGNVFYADLFTKKKAKCVLKDDDDFFKGVGEHGYVYCLDKSRIKDFEKNIKIYIVDKMRNHGAMSSTDKKKWLEDRREWPKGSGHLRRKHRCFEC